MKKWIIKFAIALLLVLIVAACAPVQAQNPTLNDYSAGQSQSVVDSVCPTGMHNEYIKTTETDSRNPFEISIVYLKVPNEGCSMPIMICNFDKYGYGGGGSCEIWDVQK